MPALAQITTNTPRRWVNPKALSAYTSIPVATLSTWRSTDPDRIPFHRIGKKILYDIAEVDAALVGARPEAAS